MFGRLNPTKIAFTPLEMEDYWLSLRKSSKVLRVITITLRVNTVLFKMFML